MPFFILAVLEWCRWWFDLKNAPIFLSIVACATAAIAGWQIRKASLAIQRVKLGLIGERYVGQFLQSGLLPRGYWVIHDIPFDLEGLKFNIDHVAIGPTGVYAVETKTRSKSGNERIVYDGNQILVDGHLPDRDPLSQAKGNAKALEEVLFDYAGRRIPVRPVVLYPGWWVERQAKDVDVWVLNEKHFLAYIDKESTKLTDSDAIVLAKALGRYVRDQC